MLSAGNDSYLRFPTLHGDLVDFVAQDDVWLAPVEGCWRVGRRARRTGRSPRAPGLPASPVVAESAGARIGDKVVHGGVDKADRRSLR